MYAEADIDTGGIDKVDAWALRGKGAGRRTSRPGGWRIVSRWGGGGSLGRKYRGGIAATRGRIQEGNSFQKRTHRWGESFENRCSSFPSGNGFDRRFCLVRLVGRETSSQWVALGLALREVGEGMTGRIR